MVYQKGLIGGIKITVPIATESISLLITSLLLSCSLFQFNSKGGRFGINSKLQGVGYKLPSFANLFWKKLSKDRLEFRCDSILISVSKT